MKFAMFYPICKICQISYKVNWSKREYISAIVFMIKDQETCPTIVTNHLIIDVQENSTKLFGRANFDKPIIDLSYAMDIHPNNLYERLTKLKKLILFS